MIYISRPVFNLKRRTKRFTGKRRQITGFGFALKNTYQTQKSLKSNKMIYISRHVFNSKRRTKHFTGNPRQITGFGFALKTPTKLKIHLNPTK
jgi:hypothetical protein